jgi:hypothetical protein
MVLTCINGTTGAKKRRHWIKWYDGAKNKRYDGINGNTGAKGDTGSNN